MAVNIGEELSIINFKGRLQILVDNLTDYLINEVLGIMHIRLSTHGETSCVSSHFHLNKEKIITVVHNGIIENYI